MLHGRKDECRVGVGGVRLVGREGMNGMELTNPRHLGLELVAVSEPDRRLLFTVLGTTNECFWIA